ncbi:hypothetical protein SmJEL517_g03352 [Synchytrium microbalum]|uniref:Mannose-P-dolichol utilization defect 1 protein homolog n=1 Tax=Synchytrium microbalum TaxID=1806994 RepID=A0A507C8P3_9FUNG|nr:uncharacterized protein SmJEL517_g03352 [Synchytrium microbalum]TPX33875.1 hypothetical protein SmJEL517_g03352 [Synchytrium microbalum]
MEIIDTALRTLVGPECTQTLLSLGFEDYTCLRLLASKGLGLGVVAGGSILKVPQILKIVASGSVTGISAASYLLETVVYLVSLAYNYRNGNAFSTYGEGKFALHVGLDVNIVLSFAFITMQNFIVLLLLFTYSRQVVILLAVAGALSAATYALFDPTLVNSNLLVQFQWGTIFLALAAKLPQIYTNYSNSSTGQLSSITVLLTLAGSAARVFTTWQEVKDPAILTAFVVATVLNLVLALQVVMYPKPDAKASRPKSKSARPIKKPVKKAE